LGKPYGLKPYWEQLGGEPFGNLMGTHEEQGEKTKTPSPPTSPKRKKLDHS